MHTHCNPPIPTSHGFPPPHRRRYAFCITLMSTSKIRHIYHMNNDLAGLVGICGTGAAKGGAGRGETRRDETRRRWTQRTYRYGENFDAMLSISCSLMYFHLPPLPLSFEVSRPMYVAIPRLAVRH
jgi:hypothetical protein